MISYATFGNCRAEVLLDKTHADFASDMDTTAGFVSTLLHNSLDLLPIDTLHAGGHALQSIQKSQEQ